MKRDAPFLIGSTNLFDYQATTGLKRWNTLVAATHTAEPSEADVHVVMQQTGMGYIQARNHVIGRMQLQQM